MAYQGEDNDVPVRSPINLGTAETASTQDDQDYSTIKRLLEIVEEAEKKCDSIRLIDPQHPKLSADQQAVAYQFCLDELITPAKALLEGAINDVDELRKESFNGSN